MNNEITNEEFQSFAPTIRDNFIAYFGPRCTAFAARMPDGTAIQFGSGVLLQIADSYFALTAAHIFNTIQERKLPVGLMAGLNDNPLLWLDESNSKGQLLQASKLDVAVISLSNKLATRMQESGRRFCRLMDAEPNDRTSDQARNAWYLMLGFPSENQKLIENGKTIYTQAQFYCTTSLAPDAVELKSISEYDPHLHLAVDYNKVRARCASGHAGGLPNPGGMSGGGCWRIADTFQELCLCDLSKAKLVGVETGWYPKYSIMKSTKLGIAIAIIHQSFPELRKAIELNYPLPTTLVKQVVFKPLA
jgi:hypothetical protein